MKFESGHCKITWIEFKYVPALCIHEAIGKNGPDDKLSCALQTAAL